jgi:hypothetical protein
MKRLLPKPALAEARLSDFKSTLQDIREQRDRWQRKAQRLAALAITNQRKEPPLRSLCPGGNGCESPTGALLFLWAVGLPLWGRPRARFERPQLGGTNGICEQVHVRIKISTEK